MVSIRRLLYGLKKREGVKVDFYREVSIELDILTGKKTYNRIKYPIKSAVFLQQREGFRNPIVPRMNPILPFSGQIEIDNAELLLDGRDFPKDFQPTTDDYVIIRNQRYEIKSIHVVDNDQSYYFILKDYKGNVRHEQHSRNLVDWLQIIQVLDPKHELLFTFVLDTQQLIFTDDLIINQIHYNRVIEDQIVLTDTLVPPIVYNGVFYTTYQGVKSNIAFLDNVAPNMVWNRSLSSSLNLTQSMIRDEPIIMSLNDYIDIDQHIQVR